MSSLAEEVQDGKIGRFPVWIIGALLAGAIVLFMWIRNRNKNAEPDPEVAPIGGEQLEGVGSMPLIGYADDIGGNYPPYVELAAPPQQPLTNAQWLRAAFDFLVGLSFSPFAVQTALQKYLAGSPLTSEEREIVERATANSNLGLPPEGTNIPTVTNPPPAPPPGTPPPTAPKTHDVAKAGENLYDFCSKNGVDFVTVFGEFKGDVRALNPTLRSYMTWSGSGTKIPTFNVDRTVRIR